jgi:hypothetical protein
MSTSMSAAPRNQPPDSVADSLQWKGDWELWNGTAVAMSPSPFGPHERAAAKLVDPIESCLRRRPARVPGTPGSIGSSATKRSCGPT